jgi:hypothetical protein
MTRFYIQREARARETAGALAVALGVGSLLFYLVRMLLSRESFDSEAPPRAIREPGSRRRAANGEAGR